MIPENLYKSGRYFNGLILFLFFVVSSGGSKCDSTGQGKSKGAADGLGSISTQSENPHTSSDQSVDRTLDFKVTADIASKFQTSNVGQESQTKNIIRAVASITDAPASKALLGIVSHVNSLGQFDGPQARDEIINLVKADFYKDSRSYFSSNMLLAALDLSKPESIQNKNNSDAPSGVKDEIETVIVKTPQVGLTEQVSPILLNNPGRKKVSVLLNNEKLQVLTETPSVIFFLNPVNATSKSASLVIQVGELSYGPFPYAVLSVKVTDNFVDKNGDPSKTKPGTHLLIEGLNSLEITQFALIGAFIKKSSPVYVSPITSNRSATGVIVENISNSADEIGGFFILNSFLSVAMRAQMLLQDFRQHPEKYPGLKKGNSTDVRGVLPLKIFSYFIKNSLADDASQTSQVDGTHTPCPYSSPTLNLDFNLPTTPILPGGDTRYSWDPIRRIFYIPRCGGDVTAKYIEALNKSIKNMRDAGLIGVGRAVGIPWMLMHGSDIDFWADNQNPNDPSVQAGCPLGALCKQTVTLAGYCLRQGALSDMMYGMIGTLLGLDLTVLMAGGHFHELLGHIVENNAGSEKSIGLDPIGAQAAYAAGAILANNFVRDNASSNPPANSVTEGLIQEIVQKGTFPGTESTVASMAAIISTLGLAGELDKKFGDGAHNASSSLSLLSAMQIAGGANVAGCQPCTVAAKVIRNFADISPEDLSKF